MRTETNRWTIVAGALIVQIILGTVYAFSVFVKPLQMEFGWDRTTTQWAFSFALVTFAITMIPAGRLQDRLGPRRVASIGGLLLGLSFLLGAFLVSSDRPWMLYLTYGIVGGAGIGFAYVCPIAAAVKWFPDKKGLITGLSVAGFGAGALFFAGPASTLLLPPGETSEALGLSQILLVGLGISKGSGFGIGWQAFFLLHGIVCAAVVLLGATLLKKPTRRLAPTQLVSARNRPIAPTRLFLVRNAQHPAGLHALDHIYFWGNFGANGHWPVETYDERNLTRQNLCSRMDGRFWPLCRTRGHPGHIQCTGPHFLGQSQ